jgi:hypothetical protein
MRRSLDQRDWELIGRPGGPDRELPSTPLVLIKGRAPPGRTARVLAALRAAPSHSAERAGEG